MKHSQNNGINKLIFAFILLFLLADMVLLIFNILGLSAKEQIQDRIYALETSLESLTSETGTSGSPSIMTESVPEETNTTGSTAETETYPSTETDTTESASEADAAEPSVMDALADTFLAEAESMGETWSVSLQKLPGGSMEGYRADTPMQSASVIKVFIMAAVYSEVCYPPAGTESIYFPEQYDGELRELLQNMITVSDNDAANRLVEGLGNGNFETGAAVVNAYCQENGYTNTSLGRRFLAENPVSDNYTSAADCCRILSDIYNGTCVCPEASAKMLELLKGQTRTEKIPSGLPDGTASANKTGEMPEGYGLGCIENDIAIVFGGHTDYILCILSNNLAGNNEGAKERIRNISSWVYDRY